MPEALLLAARMAGVATGAGFVAMMFIYFRSGPRKAADRFMSAAVLAAAAAQYAGFLAAAGIPPARSAACLVLLAAANGLFWSARAAHGATRPAAVFGGEVPAAVVRCGPYRVVRHPFYLAYVLSYLALAVVGGRWWQYGIVAVVFALYNRAAMQEEHLLTASPAVGAEYAAYHSRTWRWCPPVW